MSDAYEICRRIKHYHAKNGYSLRVDELHCDKAYIEKLVSNGVIELRPVIEGGPPIGVVLTDKGLRMANKTWGR